MLNNCSFIGHLGADPETKSLKNGSVVNLRIGVTERWKDSSSGERRERTEWVPISIFSEGLGRVAQQYLRKGSKVYVSGTWRTRRWQTQDGQDRYSTEIVLQGYDAKLLLLDAKEGGKSDPAQSAQSYEPGTYGDSEIPF